MLLLSMIILQYCNKDMVIIQVQTMSVKFYTVARFKVEGTHMSVYTCLSHLIIVTSANEVAEVMWYPPRLSVTLFVSEQDVSKSY